MGDSYSPRAAPISPAQRRLPIRATCLAGSRKKPSARSVFSSVSERSVPKASITAAYGLTASWLE